MNDMATRAAEPVVLQDDRQAQFRYTRVQLFNWGTFNGLTTINVSPKGHLILGASGSGKSTVLDVGTALFIVNSKDHFNAAAAGAEKRDRDDERSIVTYVRGAWKKETGEGGERVRNFLRPGPTWSAIGQEYTALNGAVVTLVRVFWIKGNSTASGDVKHAYFIARRRFDLQELQAFAQSQFDERKFKASLDPQTVRFYPTFSAFEDGMRALFHIESEIALKLLVKTQSAKTQKNLSLFMREYMLDRPDTFDAADSLVTGFRELKEAHFVLDQARQQIECLRPARASYDGHEKARKDLTLLEEVELATDAYWEQRKKELLDEQIRAVDIELAQLREAERRCKQAVDETQAELQALNAQLAGLDSGRLQSLEADLERQKADLANAQDKRARLDRACAIMDWSTPDGPGAFEERQKQAGDALANGEQQSKVIMDRNSALSVRREQLQGELSHYEASIRAMLDHPSKIDRELMRIRQEIVDGTGIPIEQLPFAAELMEVHPDEQRIWQGAIERALGGFARSLLAHPNIAGEVIRFIDQHNLRGDLTCIRTSEHSRPAAPMPKNALPNKLTFKEDSRYASWLKHHLALNFNHACVDTAQELEQLTGRGLTPRGQIKSGERFMKRDRVRIDDDAYWVIGFDNTAKIALFRERAADVQRRLNEVDAEARRVMESLGRLGHVQRACTQIRDLAWQEVDVVGCLENIRRTKDFIELESIRNPEIASLKREIEIITKNLSDRNEDYLEAQGDRKSADDRLKDYRDRIGELRPELLTFPISPLQRESIDLRIAKVATKVSLHNQSHVEKVVGKGISEDKRTLSVDIERNKNGCVKQFESFRARWPAEAEIDATIDSAPDFMQKLKRLEDEDLPQFLDRFMNMLHKHSDEGIAALSKMLESEIRSMHARLAVVNAGLSTTDFNEGTNLQIECKDRSLPEVVEFKNAMRELMGRILSTDEAVAEQQFKQIAALVHRLGSHETLDLTWRTKVLDVREHVEFFAREFNRDGLEVDVYDSGSERSGGQQQKLAATLLASALRYQLGGRDAGLPRFATVFLDEAFSNSDPEFTQLAMNVFQTFGFQVVMATPMKCVQAVEPFIGGATYVSIKDKKRSQIKAVEYLADRKMLDLPQAERQSYIDAES
jgi:uncharacterized protein YPO0396